MVGPWNSLPVSDDFTSLHPFKYSILKVDFEKVPTKMLMVKLVLSCECIVYLFTFTLISILLRGEIRALLCPSVQFNTFDHVLQYVLYSSDR